MVARRCCPRLPSSVAGERCPHDASGPASMRGVVAVGCLPRRGDVAASNLRGGPPLYARRRVHRSATAHRSRLHSAKQAQLRCQAILEADCRRFDVNPRVYLDRANFIPPSEPRLETRRPERWCERAPLRHTSYFPQLRGGISTAAYQLNTQIVVRQLIWHIFHRLPWRPARFDDREVATALRCKRRGRWAGSFDRDATYSAASLRRGLKPHTSCARLHLLGRRRFHFPRACPAARHRACCRAWSARAVSRGMCSPIRERRPRVRAASGGASENRTHAPHRRTRFTPRASSACSNGSACSAKASRIATSGGSGVVIAKSSSPTSCDQPRRSPTLGQPCVLNAIAVFRWMATGLDPVRRVLRSQGRRSCIRSGRRRPRSMIAGLALRSVAVFRSRKLLGGACRRNRHETRSSTIAHARRALARGATVLYDLLARRARHRDVPSTATASRPTTRGTQSSSIRGAAASWSRDNFDPITR